MRMKKRMLLLAAALACFPVWASAEILINGVPADVEKDWKEHRVIYIEPEMNGATISGRDDNVYLEVDAGVTALTLKDLTITAPSDADSSGYNALRYAFEQENDNTLTLTIEGSNILTGGSSTDNSGGLGILVYDGSLAIQGKPDSSLTVTGGDSTTGYGGYGIDADLKLVVETEGTVTANGGAGGEGGQGLVARQMIDLTGTVTANGGASESVAGSGISARSLMIRPGSDVKANGGEGQMSMGVKADLAVVVEDSTLKAAGKGDVSVGILIMSGKLAVSGDSVVTAEGSWGGAATVGTDNGLAAAAVEANGLVIRAGASETSAKVVDDYTELTNYLRIGGTAPIGGADLPQTGDHSRMGLWCLLAGLSALGMTALRTKKEA